MAVSKATRLAQISNKRTNQMKTPVDQLTEGSINQEIKELEAIMNQNDGTVEIANRLSALRKARNRINAVKNNSIWG
jgi:hypothetical protein